MTQLLLAIFKSLANSVDDDFGVLWIDWTRGPSLLLLIDLLFVLKLIIMHSVLMQAIGKQVCATFSSSFQPSSPSSKHYNSIETINYRTYSTLTPK